MRQSLPFFVNDVIHDNLNNNIAEIIVVLVDAIPTGKVIGFDPKIFDNVSDCTKLHLLLMNHIRWRF